jgi:TonB family protein
LKFIIAVFMAVGTVAPASAQTVTDPDWVERPTVEQVAHAYPKLAIELGTEGVATVSCQIRGSGALQDCTAAQESPEGFGFSAAALSLTPYFRLSPPVQDGRPIQGEVKVPIRFILPPPRAFAEPGAPTSPGALVLARQLAQRDGRMEQVRAVYRGRGQLLEFRPTPGVSPEARKSANATLRGAVETHIGGIQEHLAAIYAAHFTEMELADLLRSARNDPPPPILVPDQALARTAANFMREADRLVTAAARAEYCRARRCAPDRDFGLPRSDSRGRRVTIPAPIWLEQPTIDQIERARPPLPRVMRIEGRVELACTVGPHGLTEICDVTEESPVGLGFGAAALKVRKYFRLSPAMMQRETGDVVAIQMRFIEPPAIRSASEIKPSSDAALKLAAEYVELIRLRDAHTRTIARSLQSFDEQTFDGVNAQDRAAARAAYQTGAEVAWSDVRAFAVKAYAADQSEAQLRSSIAFLQTPGGQAYIARQRVMEEAFAGVMGTYDAVITAEAGRAYCRLQGCAGPAARSPPPPPRTTRKS